MPFTLAHAAAALPFRRTCLIFSALVVGCFAPDLEDFIRLGPGSGFGHSFAGIFAFDLPVAIAVLWLFHKYAKEPLWTWLPESTRRKVRLGPATLPARTPPQFAILVLSILIGILTHILWDWFTHTQYWPYQHWHFLHRVIELPLPGIWPIYKVLGYGSTVVGSLLFLIFFAGSPDSAAAAQQDVPQPVESKRGVLVVFICVAVIAASVRTWLGVGPPVHHHISQIFLTEFATTAITVVWVEVVIYGMMRSRNGSILNSKPSTP